MKFAFAGIDFLGDTFDALVASGWEPIKLFTRPCDDIYDFNDRIVAQAKSHRIPIQLSRLRQDDIAALHQIHGRDWTLVVAGYPWLVTGWKGRARYALNLHPSPLPIGRGPYPLFGAILGSYERWGVTAHVLAENGFDEGDILAQDLFALDETETHESLLTKCQLAARRLAAGPIAKELSDLWRRSEPQGDGSYWPRVGDAERLIDFRKDVASILRQVRAFGAIETIARLGEQRIYVAVAEGWREQHRHKPGTIVHRYRRIVVIAAGDGFVQLTRWSPLPLSEVGQMGR